MLNIFKDVHIFSEDFIPFKCREMTLLYIIIYNTSALTLHTHLHIYEVDILTNHTYLHLKQFFWIFKWCSDLLHTNIIKTHCLSVFLSVYEALMYKEALGCYSMFIYDYFPSGD